MAYLTYQGKFLRYNGKMLATIQELPPPPDAVSLNPTSYHFTTSGGSAGVSVVTSSIAGTPSGWSASLTSDVNSIIVTFDSAGNSGDTINVEVIINSSQHIDCANATITVTCGTATADLVIYQDGTVIGC